jgi:hypothetical protein
MTKLEREQARAQFKAVVEAKLKAHRPRRGPNAESALTRSILAALSLVKGLEIWRVNSGKVRMGAEGGRLIALAPTGTADLIGCLDGRFIGLEVKTPAGRVTPAQVAWAERIRGVGGFVATVRSVDEAVAAVSRAKGGERE